MIFHIISFMSNMTMTYKHGESIFMRFSGRWLIALLLVVGFSSVAARAHEGGIRVVGEATATVRADIARFVFEVREIGKNATGAKQAVDDSTQQLIALCRDAGVAEDHISVSEPVTYPRYDYETERFLGYHVARTIRVRLEDLNNRVQLMDGVAQSDVAVIRGIALDTSRRAQLEIDALQSAMASARDKAVALAESAGVGLGGVIEIEAQQFGSPYDAGVIPEGGFARRSEENAPPFAPGELSISAQVIVRYATE